MIDTDEKLLALLTANKLTPEEVLTVHAKFYQRCLDFQTARAERAEARVGVLEKWKSAVIEGTRVGSRGLAAIFEEWTIPPPEEAT